AVRLTQGRYDQADFYGKDPLDFLQRAFGGYPSRIHLVDLSGARSGRMTVWPLLEKLAAHGIAVEVGGGIRRLDTIQSVLDAGAYRCVLGTRLLQDEDFALDAIQNFSADKLVAGLDIYAGRCRLHGWEADGPEAKDAWRHLVDIGYRFANITDISRDGTLQGLDADFWDPWRHVPGDIGVGGGIHSTDDLHAITQWRIPRSIVGKAWMSGAIDLKPYLEILSE
ncbi:MAG: HisA/HisF-related TIM barrel protein, partial [Firmicutes bacterium]|nr:HisA/HisF-related TIM barrel protein [Bacillota bacterium]